MRLGRSLIVVGAAAVVSVSAVPASAWTRPVPLMTEAYAQFQGADGPLVAHRADGTAFVVWKSPVGPAHWTELRVTSRRTGGRWMSPLRIGRTKRMGYTPSLTAGGDAVAVAWPQRARTREADRLVVWRSRAGAAATTDGPPTAGLVSQATAALTGNGEILAVWREGRTAWWGVRGAGGGWSRSPLDPASRVEDLGVAASADGSAVATYRAAPAWETHTAVRAAGGVFVSAGTIEDARGFSPLPVIRGDGTAAVMGWGYPLLRSWTLSAGRWGDPAPIATGAFGSLRVARLPDGRLLAAWRSTTYTSTSRIHVAEEATAGGAWTPPTALTPERPGLGDPAIAVDADGRVLVLFTRSGDVAARVRPPARRAWSEAAVLSPAGRGCRSPGISVAPTGRALAAFVCRGPGKRSTLMASELPAPRPQATHAPETSVMR